MVRTQVALAGACAFVSIINVLVLSRLLARFSVPSLVSRHGYSYTGLDFPIYLIPPQELPHVALEVEETVHNGIGAAAMSDWEGTVTGVFGWYKLGPSHHEYSSTMYHERHCLRMLHRALTPEAVGEKVTNGHAQHCLNYIRQMTLCHPDLTLEPPDVLSRHWDIDRTRGSTHVCRDWSLALRRGNELQTEWHRFIGQQWEAGDIN
ncbi:hypothetical protein AURDEDRAFT_108556 [Auricularia subglabra TFB-10046 SS5]|uniref:Uncharacterized protein n=1 Tax=Auricularia subglabra (strain TFB-10046 / SS5) TaxID=717982 RepID=J0D9M5_AURST|nr:hypothetical protein AURDEDRAFT_108556 [Auricularia subglabra TFB-10046 SS5]